MYEKINNIIWNTLAALCLVVVGYALARVHMAYQDPLLVEEGVVVPVITKKKCDYGYATNALKSVNDVLFRKSRTTTPESARAAYRDAMSVLNEAILMMDAPNGSLPH